MPLRATTIPRMFWSALHAWWYDDAPRLGASLAYCTLFAIAPILIVATAVAGMVFGAEAVRGEIVGQLDQAGDPVPLHPGQLVGRDGALAVQALLEPVNDGKASSPRCSAARRSSWRPRAPFSSFRRR